MVLLHFSSTARQRPLRAPRPQTSAPSGTRPQAAAQRTGGRSTAGTPARSSGPQSASRYCCGAGGRRGRSAHRDEVKQPLLGPLRGHVGSARDASAAKARRLLDGAPPRERGKRRRRQAGAASPLQHARMRHAREVHQRHRREPLVHAAPRCLGDGERGARRRRAAPAGRALRRARLLPLGGRCWAPARGRRPNGASRATARTRARTRPWCGTAGTTCAPCSAAPRPRRRAARPWRSSESIADPQFPDSGFARGRVARGWGGDLA